MNAHSVDIWNEAITLPKEKLLDEIRIRDLARAKMTEARVVSAYESIFELWEDNPHRFFMFEIAGRTYCGSKWISPIVTEHGSPGLFCSIIKVEMILGALTCWQTSQAGVTLHYQGLTAADKYRLFAALTSDRNVNIFYPFAHLDKGDRCEVNTPPEGWFFTPERAEILGKGEDHFRKLSAELVKSEAQRAPVIYDPACSTGQFLSEIKRVNPNATVIGQDLSREMCNEARKHLDQVYHGDSLQPAPGVSSCDWIFFRFLNAEVVTTVNAQILFNKLSGCLRPGGRAILFGHTPVLVPLPLMKENFRVRSANQVLPAGNGVFQYYDLEKN